MSIGVKYHYTHFIYPFVIDEKRYHSFIYSIQKNSRVWKYKMNNFKDDVENYSFFLPYMQKFLFPTLYWNEKEKNDFKKKDSKEKARILGQTSCVCFEYDLKNIKNSVLARRKENIIDFDITELRLICFAPGICFFDIKTEIDEAEDIIDLSNIIDFNNSFRRITPSNCDVKDDSISVRSLNNINDIAIFIKSTIAGFEAENLENKYYSKLFTYSYVCLDKDTWSSPEDINKIRESFYKLQYNQESNKTTKFNPDYDKLKSNVYSRWQYSLFGFSRESGVVMTSEVEKYNITYMPYVYEKNYFYMLLLAVYQRISLINLSQEMMSNDNRNANKVQKKLTRFTHITWFGQITNSENGMDIWKKWQDAFELRDLYEEVHRQANEYHNMVSSSIQDKISVIVFIIYIANIILVGIQILVPLLNIQSFWVEVMVTSIIALIAAIYPMYLIGRWIKKKVLEKRI